MTGTAKLLLAVGGLYLLSKHQAAGAVLPMSPAYGTGYVGPYSPETYADIQPPEIDFGGPQSSELQVLAGIFGNSVPAFPVFRT